jgi:hypothetical protein
MPPRGHLLHPRQTDIDIPVARGDDAHVALHNDDNIAGLNQITELFNECARWDVACGSSAIALLRLATAIGWF